MLAVKLLGSVTETVMLGVPEVGDVYFTLANVVCKASALPTKVMLVAVLAPCVTPLAMVPAVKVPADAVKVTLRLLLSASAKVIWGNKVASAPLNMALLGATTVGAAASTVTVKLLLGSVVNASRSDTLTLICAVAIPALALNERLAKAALTSVFEPSKVTCPGTERFTNTPVLVPVSTSPEVDFKVTETLALSISATLMGAIKEGVPAMTCWSVVSAPMVAEL